MRHESQVEVLEQLLSHVENHTNHDAGCQLRVPLSDYVDSDLAAREWQVLFREHPQLIGLSGDLPEADSFFTLDDFGVPLLAVRDKNGCFRAYVNACRHRGAQVVEDSRGNAGRFVCPFHGWTYKSTGELAGVTEAEQFGQVDKSCLGLVELPASERHGMLWVHPQVGGTLDVDTMLGEMAGELENWALHSHQYVENCRLEKDMNWKLANDTFGETYHFSRLHSRTLNQLNHGDAIVCTPFGRHHRAVFPSRGIGYLRQKPREKWRTENVATVLYYLFPNIQMTVSERQITLFRIYPVPGEPGRSRTYVSYYFSRTALEQMTSGEKTPINADNIYDRSARDGNAIITPEAVMEVINSTLDQEDFRMAEATQKTATAGQLSHVLFGRNEAPLHHFHKNFRDALGRPAPEAL